MPGSTFSHGWYYQPGLLRIGTKGGTFSPETLVPARSPGLEVLLDRDYSTVVQQCKYIATSAKKNTPMYHIISEYNTTAH
jgi:hypothetical protein